jgi:hypothetical protein
MQAYTKTDQQLHLLSQTIAKANRTYVSSKPDDSHTNLYFDALDNRIDGHWINNGKEKIILTLNLNPQQFEWLNESRECIYAVTTFGKAIDEIENEIAGRLPDLGLNPKGFIDKLHFDIPEYPFAKEPVEEIDNAELNEWKSYRNLANELCALVLGDLQLESEIRIWPHHFDTGIYVEIAGKLGLGFGLAMEDSMAGAPYFYMSGYPLHGTIEYNNLPELTNGRWELGEYWKGTILPLNKLKSGLFEENKNTINDYLSNSINWFSKQH